MFSLLKWKKKNLPELALCTGNKIRNPKWIPNGTKDLKNYLKELGVRIIIQLRYQIMYALPYILSYMCPKWAGRK